VAYPSEGGSALEGFPAVRQGLGFLAAPIVTGVRSDGQESALDGGDSNAMHAYTGTGAMSAGFPEWTTGWTVFCPSAGDLLSWGSVDVVSVTREGYLFAWRSSGPASAYGEWWRCKHDEWNTGNYQSQTRPPGVVREASWKPGQPVVRFQAPGAVWYRGRPQSYRVTFEPSGLTEQVAATVDSGGVEEVSVPAGVASIAIQAVNGAGLLGRVVVIG